MVERKEGLALSPRRETLARMTYQRFFRRYRRLAGMTGTAAEVAAELEHDPGLELGARCIVTGGAYRGERGAVVRRPLAAFAFYVVTLDGRREPDAWGQHYYILPGDLAPEPTDEPDCRNDGEPGHWVSGTATDPTDPTDDDDPALTALLALAEQGALDDPQGDALAEQIAADVRPRRKRDPRTPDERALDRARLRLREGAVVECVGEGAWLVASNRRAGVVHRVRGGVCSCEAAGVCWHLKAVEINEAEIEDDDGTLDEDTLHAGLPVERGEKWIATKWLRERPYRRGA
jgi:hypothetical protein